MSPLEGKVRQAKRNYRRFLIRAALAILLFLLVMVVRTFYIAGEFKSIQPHFEGNVRAIQGIVGGEDITIDHASQEAFISADDRFGRQMDNANAVGAIYLLDLSDQTENTTAQPVELRRIPNQPIAPHGISLVKGTDGQRYLYVVDHHSEESSSRPTHRILLYLVEADKSLRLVQAFEDSSYLISPNDVVGIDENRFYFTNDHGSSSTLGRTIEEYLQLRKSNVIYYDGTSYGVAATGIAMANGINVSSDGSELYVASTLGKSVLIYDRDPNKGSLSQRAEIYLDTGVDNIERDEQGNLWIGCHPKLLTFVRHSKDTKRFSPSQVIKLSRTGSGEFLPEEIFLDDGELISGSSVGAVSGNILLVGPVLDDKILWCELPRDDPLNSSD